MPTPKNLDPNIKTLWSKDDLVSLIRDEAVKVVESAEVWEGTGRFYLRVPRGEESVRVPVHVGEPLQPRLGYKPELDTEAGPPQGEDDEAMLIARDRLLLSTPQLADRIRAYGDARVRQAMKEERSAAFDIVSDLPPVHYLRKAFQKRIDELDNDDE